jgi:hypothetical protein
MIFTDYFLKFASKEQAIQVFSTIPGHTFEEQKSIQVVEQTENFAIDEVGILYENNAVYNNIGELITLPTQIEGYHYNYRIVFGNREEPPLPTELEPFLVTPETPHRIFL